MEFVITINNKRYILPVNAGSISVRRKTRNEELEIIDLGDVTLFGSKKLKEIEFESFFPRRPEDWGVATKDRQTPEKWAELLDKAMDSNKPVRFIVTDSKINLSMSIEEFDWSYEDASTDIYYRIKLIEYRDFSAKLIPPPVNPPARPEPTRPANTDKITLNCKVIVNGRLHRDSYGTGPGQTEVNATRIVNIIVASPKPGQTHPYHVATLDGGHRGWVTKGSVKRI